MAGIFRFLVASLFLSDKVFYQLSRYFALHPIYSSIHHYLSVIGCQEKEMSYENTSFWFFRAFFRRSVDKAHTYQCQEGRNCFIDITTRRNCQYCRFQKCLNSGMKTNWVLSEDERRDRLIKKRENAAQRAAKLRESIEKPVELVPTQGTFLP